MPESSFDDGARRALKAAFLLIGNESLQTKLLDEGTAPEVLQQFGLNESARPSLLTLIGRVGHKVSAGVQASLERLSKAAPGDVQEIAASQIQILTNYYDEVLKQARGSFRWALISAGIGLAFFLSAVGFLLFSKDSQAIATISVISGSLIEVISAINFFLYGKTSAQLSEFHKRLEVTQRFLLSNGLCEHLEGDAKQQGRLDLIKTIASFRAE